MAKSYYLIGTVEFRFLSLKEAETVLGVRVFGGVGNIAEPEKWHEPEL